MAGRFRVRVRPEAILTVVLVVCLAVWVVRDGYERRTPPPLAFFDPDVDVGDRYTDEPIITEFVFTNPSSETVTVSEEACCGLRAEWPDGRTVEPGATARVLVEYAGPAGEIEHAIPIRTESGEDGRITIRGRVMRGLHIHPDTPVAVLEPGGPPRTLDIRLHTDDRIPFRILGFEGPDQVRLERYADEEAENHPLSLTVYPGELGGGTIPLMFRTTHPRAETFTVPVIVRTEGDIGILPDRFFLDGRKNEATVRLFSRSDEPFEVGVVEQPGGASLTKRSSDDRTVHAVSLRFDGGGPPPYAVTLQLPEGRIAVPVWPARTDREASR